MSALPTGRIYSVKMKKESRFVEGIEKSSS